MNDYYRPMRTTRRPQNYTSVLPKWFKVTNQASGPTQIVIYDEIGMLGCSVQDFTSELAAVKGDIDLHISSPGGDVFDGITIYNRLRAHDGVVSVVIDGLAASAASFIAMAASPGKLGMSPHSQLMIHDGFSMVIGNAADLRTTADLLDQVSDNIAGIYADRTGKPVSYFRDLMKDEKWFSDQEAVDTGLADYIIGKEPVANNWDLSVYNTVPGIENADTTPQVLDAAIPPETPGNCGDDNSLQPNETSSDDIDTSALAALFTSALKGVK